MTCPRCMGLLVREHATDHREWVSLWRCLLCGMRLDRVILLHWPLSWKFRVCLATAKEGERWLTDTWNGWRTRLLSSKHI